MAHRNENELAAHIWIRSPRYLEEQRHSSDITARPRLLSVTESLELPPNAKNRQKSDTRKFDVREWLVPPVLMPVFFGLLIVAAVIIQW